MVFRSSVSRGSCRAGHGHSQIQWRSESVAMQRGQCAFLAVSWGFVVYSEYREPSTFQPVISFMMVERRAWDCCGSFQIFFEHGEGEASEVLFTVQVIEGVGVAAEDDGGGHAGEPIV